MKSKKQVSIERRVFCHLKGPLSINFSLLNQWSNSEAIRNIKGKTWDVSTAGLCLETEIDMRDGSLEFIETEGEEKLKVIPCLVSSEKKIRLELHLHLGTRRFVVRGKAIWYELASEGSASKLKIGVLFTDMPREARDKWVRYVRTQTPF